MKQKCVSCSSCGMPMENAEDFSMADAKSIYCRYCTDQTGKLFPFEKILKSNTEYYQESQGISEVAARKMANDLLTSQPAWRKA